MVKGYDASDEILGLLGGSAGLKRLNLVEVKRIPGGISCFWGDLPMKACVVISKEDGRFIIAIQHFNPVSFSSYSVPAEKVKAVVKWALIRKVPA